MKKKVETKLQKPFWKKLGYEFEQDYYRDLPKRREDRDRIWDSI